MFESISARASKYENEHEKELVPIASYRKEKSLVPKGVMLRKNSVNSINLNSIKKNREQNRGRSSKDCIPLK